MSLWHDRVEEANFWPDLEEARNLLAETSPDYPEAPAQMDQIGAVLDFAEYRLNIADARLVTGSQLSIVNNKMNNIMDHLRNWSENLDASQLQHASESAEDLSGIVSQLPIAVADPTPNQIVSSLGSRIRGFGGQISRHEKAPTVKIVTCPKNLYHSLC